MHSPKYQSYFIINHRREYQKANLNNSLQLPYKSPRENLHSAKRLSVTSRCHRVLWEKDKENVVLGGVKSYLTGRKIAQQQFHVNKTAHVKNSHLNSLNRSFNGSATSRESHLFDRSGAYQNSNAFAKKQLQKNFDLMTKSLYNRQEVESKVQIEIKPVTQQAEGEQFMNKNFQKSQMRSSNFPLSFQYERKTNQNKKVTESIINRHKQFLENSIKADSLLNHTFEENKFLKINENQKENEAKEDKIQTNENQVEFNLQTKPNLYPHRKIHSFNFSSSQNPTHLPKNPLMDSSVTSNRSSKKSRIIQFKQHCNNTLENEQILQTEIIQAQTAQQESSFKSFTKDELCSSFYEPQEEHLPHRLLVGNSNRKNNILASQKKQIKKIGPSDTFKMNLASSANGHALTFRDFSGKAEDRQKALLSRSMKENPIQRKSNENRSQVRYKEFSQDKSQGFDFSNILTSQSQHIKPSKTQQSEELISVNGFVSMKPNLTSSQNRLNPSLNSQSQARAPIVVNIGSSYKKVLDLNPKPCQSFILDTNQEVQETQVKQGGVFLEGFYEQQLKRRSEANKILKSLMNMKMIHESLGVNATN